MSTSKINNMAKFAWTSEILRHGGDPITCLQEAFRKHRKMGTNKFYSWDGMTDALHNWLGAHVLDLRISQRQKTKKENVVYWYAMGRSEAWIANRIIGQL